jgi:hypothetical protein
MKRREFITLIGGAAALPFAARAQQPAVPVYRVGYLAGGSRDQQLHLIFEEGLRSIGYRVGENVVIEYRFADGEVQRLPALAGPARRGHHRLWQPPKYGCGHEGDQDQANQMKALVRRVIAAVF